jgi:hypothetical protein
MEGEGGGSLGDDEGLRWFAAAGERKGVGLWGFDPGCGDGETMPAAARRSSAAVDVRLGPRLYAPFPSGPPWKMRSLVSQT